jgi:asparagine synthase (glutamine-hydrolysing)
VADVPIGAFLSGGLDSSIVLKHLAESCGEPVRTFSVGFPDRKSHDETAYARLVARRFDTEHHEIQFTSGDIIDVFPRVLDHLCEPFGDSSIVPTSVVSAFARRHVTVALAGDGGDELFSGYYRHFAHHLLATYRSTPWLVRKLLVEPAMIAYGGLGSSRTAHRARVFRGWIATAETNPLERHILWTRNLSPTAEVLYADPDAARRLNQEWFSRAARLIEGTGFTDDLGKVLAFDMQMKLPFDMLQKVDLGSMMHSLEVRSPFLDPMLVDSVFSLPSSYKMQGGVRKRILIDAYRGHLPDEILDRGKRGFEVPFGELLRGPLLPVFRDVVTRDAIEAFGIFSYEGVQQVLADFLAQKGERADALFALLSLCWWHGRTRSVG